MDAWGYFLKAAKANMTEGAASHRATAEGEAAMTLLQLSSGGANPPPGEPREEQPLLPVAAAAAGRSHRITLTPQDVMLNAILDGPQVPRAAASMMPMPMPGHVSGAGASRPMMPMPGHVSGAGASRPMMPMPGHGHVFGAGASRPMMPMPGHVSGAGASRPMMPMPLPGHGHVVSGGAAPALYNNSAPPVENMFGSTTGQGSSSSSLQAAAAAWSSAVVRDKNKGKRPVVSDAAAKKKPMINPKKRPLHGIRIQQEEEAREPPARRRIVPLPLPASSVRFKCSRCGLKFPTFHALGGHMAGHSKANRSGITDDGLAQFDIDGALQSLHGGAVNTAAGDTSWFFGRAPQPTAPILGGNMRMHWMADQPRAETSRAAIDAAPRGQPRDFDLNEMPSEE